MFLRVKPGPDLICKTERRKYWVISQPGTCAIAGARNAEQAIQNAGAAEVKLSDEDLVLINQIGKMVTDHMDDRSIMWNF